MFVVGLYFYFLLSNEWYHKTRFGVFSKYVKLAASEMWHAATVHEFAMLAKRR